MPALFATAFFVLAIGCGINPASAAHAGFHVQFPWMTRGPNPSTRLELNGYNPFCGEIVHDPQEFTRHSRTFLSFSGHSGDLVTVRYTQNRVPRNTDDFPYMIIQDVPIQPSGQLCVNVTIPFETKLNEMGVMYFEARDPKTGSVKHHCSDVQMTDEDALPEEHPAMCAANNDTLIPMPDEYLLK